MQGLLRTRSGLIFIALAAILLLLANNLLFSGWRIDLTESKLYTLSDESRKVVSNLQEPLTLTLYFSQKGTAELPALRNYARRVQELLGEYANIAGDNIQFSVVDPQPFSEEEDAASAAGLQGIPSGVRGDEIYFGLVGRDQHDNEEVIQFFQPDKEQFLEYELTRLVYKLSHPKQPRVGIISALSLNGGFDYMTQQQSPAWVVVQQIEDLFDIEWIPEDAEQIAGDIDMLLLVHPKGLSDATLLAVDQYALSGGKVLAFVDPMAEAESSPAMMMPTSKRSDLEPLLSAWGVKLVEGKILGDYANSMVVSMGNRQGPVRHIGLMGLGPESLNQGDVVLSGLESVNLSSVGILQPLDGATTTIEPMITSSAESAPLDASLWQTLRNPEDLMKGFVPTGEHYTLAARISGPAKTAFPDGIEIETSVENESEADNTSNTETKTETRKVASTIKSADTIHVVVVADTDVLSDRLWVQVQDFFGQRIVTPWADNASLLVNLLENLSGSAELINVRSRGRYSRPFTKVEDLRRDAEERFLEQQKNLEAKLSETESKLVELERAREGGDGSVLSAEQEAELKKFAEEKLKIRKELREVQHQLDQDIEALGSQLKFINIFLIPLLLVGLVVIGRKLRPQAI